MITKIWDQISSIGYQHDHSPEEARRVQLLNRISFIGFDVMLIYMIVEIVVGIYSLLPIILIVELLFLSVLFLIHRKLYAVGKVTFMWTVTVTIVFFSIAIGSEGGSEFPIIPLSLVPLIILKDKRIAWGWLILLLTIFFGIRYFQTVIPPVIVDAPKEVLAFFTNMNIVTAIVVSFLLTYYFRLGNEEYEGKLIETNEILDVRNKEITDSIRYARRIQQAILPPDKLVKEWLKESFILYMPKDIVSGDFYWMESVDDKVLFAAVDCTGHGVPGAFVSIVGHNGLNRCVNEFGLTRPDQILNKLNEIVDENFSRSEEELKDGMDIALCCLDQQNQKLHFAGANNPLYHIKNGELNEYKGDKQPVGRFDDRQPFTGHTLDIGKGDCVYIFTDGFADQFGGPKGKKFKYKPFKELLKFVHQLPMKEQHEIIEKRFYEWKGELEQVDDICLIGMKL